MKNAQSLLWAGKTAYAAAKETGISEGAISKSLVCRAIIQSVRRMVDSLSNDETSTDAELLEFFTGELCVPQHHAEAFLARRTDFLNFHPDVRSIGVAE